MADLIIEKYSGKIMVYEIKHGKKEKVEEFTTYDFEDFLDFINENYDYARILYGKCIY